MKNSKKLGKVLSKEDLKKIKGGIILCQPGFSYCKNPNGFYVCCCLNPNGCI